MAKILAFLEETYSRLGGFAPLVYIAALFVVGFLVLFLIAYVRLWLIDAFNCVKDVYWRRRIKRMPKEKLVQMAVENTGGYIHTVLHRLEDTPELLLTVCKTARGYPAGLAAERYCALMGHDWDHCVCRTCHKQRDEEHNWVFCRCETCGKGRDEEHNWVFCRCETCGKQRDAEHDWDGCKCRVCGKTRDEEHDWDGCKCRVCGKTRDEKHDWDGCKCRVCGKTRDEKHDWNGARCARCGAIREHEHIWVYSSTDHERSCNCADCNKGQPGGVEDWCGDFCFGPANCGVLYDIVYERCELCGAERRKP